MSGPKLEKWSILGSSKLTRNPISTSWYFCSTDWWTSEFRHFCIWNYQKLNKLSYYTFKNNYDSHDTLPHLYTLLDLTQTKTTLKYGSMYIWNLLGNITIWKHNFSLETNVDNIGKIHRILKIKKHGLETKSVYRNIKSRLETEKCIGNNFLRLETFGQT